MLGISYGNFGAICAFVFGASTAGVLLFRVGLSFRHYIHTGELGDADYFWFGQIMEGKGIFSPAYFTGYHPGGILLDACMLSIVTVLLIPLWAPLIIAVLLVILAQLMRKRIAHKQEFISNLKGDQL